MPTRSSNIFEIMVLNTATAAFTTNIADIEVYEGNSVTIQLGTLFTEGAPATTGAVVSLFSNMAGSQTLPGTDVLANIASVVWTTSTRTLTINTTGIDLTADRTIYGRVDVTQPDP